MFDDDEDSGASPSESELRAVAIQLARATLAGPVQAAALRARFERVLGRHWLFVKPLIRHVLLDFGMDLSPHLHDELAEAIAGFQPLREAMAVSGERPRIQGWYPFSPPMGALPRALAATRVPQLATPGDVAHWLDLGASELDWYCDFMRSEPAEPEVLRHYRYRWLRKRRGGLRLIEIPKPRLRAIQRRILDEILVQLPPHHAAHGCVRRRSALSASTPHAGTRLVLKIDLEDFFVSIGAARIRAVFRTLGYPPAAARVLAQLVSHAVPAEVVRRAAAYCDEQHADVRSRLHRQHAALRSRHLPQGAPSSPAIANLCAYRLDLRLAGAAEICGASYTRYVDDLIFSGFDDFAGSWCRFARMVYSIVLEEGFVPNWHKTRACSQARAQRVLGLVVNRHPNVPRDEYDRLKAILHNCARYGPDSQNRDAHPAFREHLLGRIARFAAVNPARADRLRAAFRRIEWRNDATPPVTNRKIVLE